MQAGTESRTWNGRGVATNPQEGRRETKKYANETTKEKKRHYVCYSLMILQAREGSDVERKQCCAL